MGLKKSAHGRTILFVEESQLIYNPGHQLCSLSTSSKIEILYQFQENNVLKGRERVHSTHTQLRNITERIQYSSANIVEEIGGSER